MAERKTTRAKTSNRTSAAAADVKTTESKKFKLTSLILPIAIVVVAVLIWLFKSQFVVATVNGQPITRIQLIKELEKKDGKAVLESLITENLIQQEANKRSLDVAQAEINAEIAKIEKSLKDQGQNIDLVLSQQGMTREDLNKQIRLQLLLKKMVGQVSVTEKEVADYIEQNKESFPDPKQEGLEAQIKAQLEQQKLGAKIQEFITNLQSKAKIEHLLPL